MSKSQGRRLSLWNKSREGGDCAPQASSTSIRFCFLICCTRGGQVEVEAKESDHVARAPSSTPPKAAAPSKAVADAGSWGGQVELEGKETHLVALSAQHRRNEVCRRRRRRPYYTLSPRTSCFYQP